ncbi:MAG: C_GCAxxG_C_C family protein [Desulfovibrio sp.]|nr:C_GCAxxG_C_C family protein [Desulfovibrio sp.]
MESGEQMAAQAAELAKSYFRDDKNNCAESVLRALMQVTGQTCPVEILRLASPFGRGMGAAGCACGALVGAEMAVGYFFGREQTKGAAPDACATAAKLMHDRFKKHNGATCCRILHKGLPFGTDEQLAACCERTLEAAEIAAQVIAEVQADLARAEEMRQ